MFVSKESIKGLVSKLKLPPPEPYSQDWEYEVADAKRIGEFIEAYLKMKNLSEGERFTLMIVILESFNDALCDGTADERDWEQISKALIRDERLHKQTIEAWANLSEANVENCFQITPRIRQILKGI